MRSGRAAKRLRLFGCALAVGTAMVSNPPPAAAQLPPPPPPPATLWSFMGVPQGYRWFRVNAFNRNGLRPGMERQPPLKAIADPRNLQSPDAAIKKAAEVKQAEDLKKQKIKAIRYLASIGCGCYNRDGSITDAMIKAMDDCTEEVRWAAVTAISEAATGEMCANCKQKSCCSEEISKKLYQIAYEHDETGCFLEPSERVRNAAIEAMRVCCPGGGDEIYFESAPSPASAQPPPIEQPSVLPPAGVERPATEPVPGIPVPPVTPSPGVVPVVPVPPVPPPPGAVPVVPPPPRGAAPVVPPQAAVPVVPPVLSAVAPETAVAEVEQKTATPPAFTSAESQPAESQPAAKPAAKVTVLPAAKTSSSGAASAPHFPASTTTESTPASQPESQPKPRRSSRRTASRLAASTLPPSGQQELSAPAPAALPVANVDAPAAAADLAAAAEPTAEADAAGTRPGFAQSIHILAPAGQAKPIAAVASPEAAAEEMSAKPTVTVRLAGTRLSPKSASQERAPATLAPIVTAASMHHLEPLAAEARNAPRQTGSTLGVPAPSSRRSAQLPIRIGAPVTR